MKKLISLFTLFITFFIALFPVVEARSYRGGYKSSRTYYNPYANPKSHSVRGYWKTTTNYKNGYRQTKRTYVNSYRRTNPDRYKWNNYSYRGGWR